jgi:hypothetical protein
MLKGEARIWWHSIEEYHHHLRLPPISDWEVMKVKLQEKYGATHHTQYPQPQQFTQHEEFLVRQIADELCHYNNTMDLLKHKSPNAKGLLSSTEDKR